MIEDWLYSNFDAVKDAAWDEWAVCCPFCQNDTKFHLYVSKVKQVANCYKCGWNGTYFQLVKDVSGADSYAEIWRQLESPITMAGFQTVVEQLQQRRQQARAALLEDMPEWYIPFSGSLIGKSAHSQMVLRYALSRLSMEQIEYYHLGVCGKHPYLDSPYAMRLIIPVERGYYQARAISAAQTPKYINPEFPIEDRLFNPQALERYDHIFICEGAISSIAIGPHAVATLGANGATDGQRARLRKAKASTYTLVVEPERVAITQAIELAKYLEAYGKIIIMRTYSSGDPADNGPYLEQPYGMDYLLRYGLDKALKGLLVK